MSYFLNIILLSWPLTAHSCSVHIAVTITRAWLKHLRCFYFAVAVPLPILMILPLPIAEALAIAAIYQILLQHDACHHFHCVLMWHCCLWLALLIAMQHCSCHSFIFTCHLLFVSLLSLFVNDGIQLWSSFDCDKCASHSENGNKITHTFTHSCAIERRGVLPMGSIGSRALGGPICNSNSSSPFFDACIQDFFFLMWKFSTGHLVQKEIASSFQNKVGPTCKNQDWHYSLKMTTWCCLSLYIHIYSKNLNEWDCLD